MTRLAATLVCCAAVLTQSLFAQAKSKDLCAPPPGLAAPSLPAKWMSGQGTEYVHLPITTSNPEAQKFFNQGLAQLHSFWASEAERSFLQAAALDPEAPMPWFGVAMAAGGDYRPRFQIDLIEEMWGKPQDPRLTPSRASKAAEKALELAKVPGKATELEKMYIAAAAPRRLPSDKDAHEAYIEALRTIVNKHPKDVEARTFLALHLMRGFTLPDRKPRPGTMEAVEMLRELAKDFPQHPGVHHYIIHGWEGGSFARDAWGSSERYPQLVPNIPHALHMPGHIWSQTGRFADAVKSFTDAAVNELGYLKADPLMGSGHHGHNVHYLSTANAFSGNHEEAMKAALSLLEFKENPREAASIDNYRTAYRQGWFALMRALVVARKWDEILEGKTLPAYNRPRETAWTHWACGLALAAKGDGAGARAEAKLMDAAFDKFTELNRRKPSPEMQAARMELEGHVQLAEGSKQGWKVLKKAASVQRSLTYSEPPHYPRPVSVALGDALLKAGQNEDAEKWFRMALDEIPALAQAEAGLRAAARPGVSGGK
jgi:tetratricopeptide (TPR) repeat protein